MSVPNLNLINFEHPASKRSEYILTSPKSLKACQRAGIKPVELLYKSLAEVRRDVGRKEAQETYERLEKERQEKLEKCRKIRNELLMQGYPHCTSSSSLREHHSNRSSPRPDSDHLNGFLESRGLKLLSIKSGGESPESNRTLQDLKDSSRSPLPAPTNHEAVPAVIDLTATPTEAPVPPPSLPRLHRSSANSPEEGSGRGINEVLSKPKETPKSRRRFVRSQSLPSRPETPVKPFSRNASSLGNDTRKLPIDDLPKRSSSRNSVSLASIATPVIDRRPDCHVSFEDINNNRFKAPVIMRPNSSRKMRQLERRKLMECKKVFDKIRAQYKDPEYCLLKYRQIIENSIERELREQEVKKVQRKIEEGVEMWQDRVLVLQWLDNERAEEQITRNLTSKIEMMRQKQRNKDIIHSINMNKVKEEDDTKAEILRRELVKKERKIQVLQEEKERVISESKTRAQAVSELKEQIRNIMTPETFDQKVNKCGRESKVHRVLHPPAKCPIIMHQSHISLG